MKYSSFFKKTIANLEIIEYPGNPEDPTVILLHGYGANASDLTFFPQHCHFKKIKPTWIFPEGIENAEGIPQGKAWFPLSITRLLDLEYQNSTDKLAELFPSELFLKPVKAIQNLITDLQVPQNRIILGGFSQGAMVSTDVVLTAKEDYLGLLILSGTLVKEEVWRKLALNKKYLRFIQSHGEEDSILPWKGASNLNRLLTSCNIKGDFISFKGGHEIPNTFFRKLTEFVEEHESMNESSDT